MLRDVLQLEGGFPFKSITFLLYKKMACFSFLPNLTMIPCPGVGNNYATLEKKENKTTMYDFKY